MSNQFESDAVYGGPNGEPLVIKEVTADFNRKDQAQVHLFAEVSSKLKDAKSVDEGADPIEPETVYATLSVGSDNDTTREIALSHLGILCGTKFEDDGESWMSVLPGGADHQKLLGSKKAYFGAREYNGTIYWSTKFPRRRPAPSSLAAFKEAMRAKALAAA